MSSKGLSRRRFLEQTAVVAGMLAFGAVAGAQEAAAGAAAASAPAAKRTASDIVALGDTGLKCSRLGLGLGSNNGQAQAALGQEGFNAFLKHAFEQGITLFDTAQAYRTFGMMAAAIKGLPREKIFIQSKIDQSDNILTTIDNHRKTFNTDYVDSMLVHIQVRRDWTETWKRAMDDYSAAQEKKWIRLKGVSCHSLPALRASIATEWTQVHLVRVNPQGLVIDNEQENASGRGANDIKPVVAELKKIGEKKRGVIGMKIYGNGQIRTDAERQKSLRFAMSMPEIDAIIIGFANIDQLDQGIKLLNGVLAEPAA
jgi:1-deoxyxylulose-5-phosphate synthase